MTLVFVELSGENRSLATAEAISAAESLGGRAASDAVAVEGLVPVEVPPGVSATQLSGRLALARRALSWVGSGPAIADRARREGASGASASFRSLGRPSAGGGPEVRSLGQAYHDGGGRIDLERPARRFWLAHTRDGGSALFEERGAVDRSGTRSRRMPLLPFQRPVSLPPALARAAANLGRIRPGDRVLDPFVGTGALLAEAGLLGARVYGIDRDADMIRGALRNLEHLKVTPESLRVGDAGEVDFEPSGLCFDAILTDPPYGRSSTTGGEGPDRLVERVLTRWSERLAPGGRISVVLRSGAPEFLPGWKTRLAGSVRAHRSLTRDFRVYER